MKRVLGVVVVVAAVAAPLPVSAQPSVDRVVLFTMPGVTWQAVQDARTPNLDAIVEEGAVAALATRTAVRRPAIERGFLSLGAGNRAFVAGTDPFAHLAFEADAPYENGTAAAALRRRVGGTIDAGIVHLGQPNIAVKQDRYLYGAEAGTLGQALRQAGIPRGVVSAGDVAIDPRVPEDLRRSSVLALVDRRGTVDVGQLADLLRRDRDAPYGVATDPDAFLRAADRALDAARVVHLDPGETVRADEFTSLAEPSEARAQRRAALERTDTVLGSVVDRLGPRDLLLVAAPAPPSWQQDPRLTVLAARGPGIERGWLTSASTQQNGQATISDIAPTILDRLGVPTPDSMTGTPLEAAPTRADARVDELIDLDESSIFRETFAATTFYVLAGGLFSVIAVLSIVVFMGWSRRPLPLLLGAAYLTLATPAAAHLSRVLEVWRLGTIGAHVALWALAAALAAGAALAVRGPRWAAGMVLMLVSVAAFAADGIMGGPLQVNGVFGHSPVVAGRFYGLGNTAATILYSSAILGFAGLIELRGRTRAPWWYAVVLAGIVGIVGLPFFGANFGQLIAGIPAVVAATILARGHRIRWRALAVTAAAVFVLAAAAAGLDLLRPAAQRTHLGRFAASVTEGGPGTLATILARKITTAFGTLGLTEWTYVIPVAVAVIAVLLLRPQGVLREVIPKHPVIRGALNGLMVYAVVGFLANDSGIAIPALVLAHVVPFLVLMAAERVEPRGMARGSDALP